MVGKKEIEKQGLYPGYVTEKARAILKESRKEYPDWAYIIEKTIRIEKFINDITLKVVNEGGL